MIRLKKLTKTYGEKIILDGIDLTCEQDEFITLFGPNGCGKSTLIKLLTQQEKPTSGSLKIKAEKIGHAFQHYRESLLPWKTPQENVLFPLLVHDVPLAEAQAKLDALIKELGVGFPDVKEMHMLSGGQAQLVCLLRTLISNPDLLILDEPFSAFDYHLSTLLREKLFLYVKSHAITTVMVTHRLEDAIYMSDRIYFLDGPPTRVIKELKVDLPQHRGRKVVVSEDFTHMRNEALGIVIDNIPRNKRVDI